MSSLSDDVNPPVHAWACWRVYKMTGRRGARDRLFLARAFQKLLINFTWWVNRKDVTGKHLFAGGFLGLDNIGLFDRSKPLPGGGVLEQADGTAWMAFYCITMLAMALELAKEDPAYEDVASKFFEHFVAIVDAMNQLGGTGLWDEAGRVLLRSTPGRRSVGPPSHSVSGRNHSAVRRGDFGGPDDRPAARIPKAAAVVSRQPPRSGQACFVPGTARPGGHGHRLLAIPSRPRLERILRYVLDENEFLSPFGVRSLSRVHKDRPYTCSAGGTPQRVDYEPGDATTALFGGNSNWRGPVWLPVNYLLVEALERYHHFYGDTLRVECPTGSGRLMNLQEVARELAARLARIFRADEQGRRVCYGSDSRFATDPHWQNLVLFHEYFHGDSGQGLGASHQTGWTALVTRLLKDCCAHRANRGQQPQSERREVPRELAIH